MLRVECERGFKLRPEKIEKHLNPWERGEKLTRKVVAEILRHLYPTWFVYVGGHHVALHEDATGGRIAMVTADSPDFS